MPAVRDALVRWMIHVLLLAAGVLVLPAAGADAVLQVGSKRFTESYILGEIITRTAQRDARTRASHKPGLGNSAILFAALKSGAIDIYPEYTGTIALELLRLQHVPDLTTLNRHLAPHGLAAGVPLGFANAYALAMRDEQAAKIGIGTLSDLARFQSARMGLSQEFLHRRDGWPALSRVYGLESLHARGLDHGIAYDALARGEIDLIDVYTTDPKILSHGLRVLRDDRHFFPAYDAVLLYRTDLPQRFPAAWQALAGLADAIPATDMIRMNAAVELQGRSFAGVAADWVAGGAKNMQSVSRHSLAAVLFGPDLPRLTLQHLGLVIGSLLLGVSIGIPLGVWAQRRPGAGYWILAASGILQTIPSLALLAFLIAMLDRIGAVPAILALFLYALLPIVRNTEAAMVGIGKGMREAGCALGLTPGQQLRWIELPLAWPGILAGIKTATVMNVGTATIAAFVGAGGYGERIVAGLAVNDHRLLLAGAVPAAVLALGLEGAFRLLEKKRMTPT